MDFLQKKDVYAKLFSKFFTNTVATVCSMLHRQTVKEYGQNIACKNSMAVIIKH